LRAAQNVNLVKSATDETQMQRGHQIRLKNPCCICGEILLAAAGRAGRLLRFRGFTFGFD
jgi:hypothetical protein